MLKISSKLFVIILILLCSSQAFSAQKFISFDFGMTSLLMPTDDRMTTNSNYFLISFPVSYKTKVGILSETAIANGTDGAVNIQGSARIQGLRFTKEIMSLGGSMSLGGVVGLGTVEIVTAAAAMSKNTSLYEIGIRMDVLNKQNKVNNLIVSIDLMYRMIPYGLNPLATTKISDLGGVGLGINIGVEF